MCVLPWKPTFSYRIVLIWFWHFSHYYKACWYSRLSSFPIFLASCSGVYGNIRCQKYFLKSFVFAFGFLGNSSSYILFSSMCILFVFGNPQTGLNVYITHVHCLFDNYLQFFVVAKKTFDNSCNLWFLAVFQYFSDFLNTSSQACHW